jgi:pimeloyl-ACP methyl ester carboxylesterase
MAFWQAEDGSLIYFEIHGKQGDKGTILLLPGLLGSLSRQWQGFIAPLAAGYRLVLVDWRGHGRSENRQLDLLPDQTIHDLLGLLDHIGATGVHVAGYDMGGYLGLMLTLRQPKRVRTLQMLATKFYWNPAAVSNIREQLDPDLIVEKSPNYASRLAEEHGAARWRQLVRQSADLVGYLGEQGIMENMLGTTQCPVLVSVGDRDELVPVQEAFLLSRALPNASLLVLPQVRHPFQSMNLNLLLPVMQDFHQ